MNNSRVIFSIVVLLSGGIIYGVLNQIREEKINMRRGVLRELEILKNKNRHDGGTKS